MFRPFSHLFVSFIGILFLWYIDPSNTHALPPDNYVDLLFGLVKYVWIVITFAFKVSIVIMLLSVAVIWISESYQ
jgi:hypothetical protein